MSAIRLSALLVAGLFGLAVATPESATAVSTNDPNPPASSQSSTPKSGTAKKKKAQKQKKSEKQFLDGYKAAYGLIYQDHDYSAGIAKLKSLGHDDHADVANLIGYSSRKLGRYDDAKVWYEKALAADPQHARTWSYYGMWHAEQGNLLKARDYLAKVESICGTGCKEYVELKGVIEGTRVY
jgi:tetratricopeptide (TPR) repeat protein